MKKCSIALLCSMLIFCSGIGHAEAFGVGAKGPDVYAVQSMLKSIGYFGGTIDGIYGPMTKQGVMYFQSKYGLPQTGAVDSKTLQSILWAYANVKISKAPQQQPEEPKQPTEGLTEDENLMLSLVNQARASAGLPALSIDLQLTKAARAKSQDMINKNYFSHQSPTYGSVSQMLKTFGISYRAVGENIACNSSTNGAHTALMNSSGHRANILGSQYTYIGIGIVDGGKCGKMFTQLFISK